MAIQPITIMKFLMRKNAKGPMAIQIWVFFVTTDLLRISLLCTLTIVDTTNMDFQITFQTDLLK